MINDISLLQGRVELGNTLYRVPEVGSIHLALFNTHGAVVRVFIVRYDLGDMPPTSHTFIRQRTFLIPKTSLHGNPQKRLQYLIHLR